MQNYGQGVGDIKTSDNLGRTNSPDWHWFIRCEPDVLARARVCRCRKGGRARSRTTKERGLGNSDGDLTSRCRAIRRNESMLPVGVKGPLRNVRDRICSLIRTDRMKGSNGEDYLILYAIPPSTA
jgi:hypothetical protein